MFTASVVTFVRCKLTLVGPITIYFLVAAKEVNNHNLFCRRSISFSDYTTKCISESYHNNGSRNVRPKRDFIQNMCPFHLFMFESLYWINYSYNFGYLHKFICRDPPTKQGCLTGGRDSLIGAASCLHCWLAQTNGILDIPEKCVVEFLLDNVYCNTNRCMEAIKWPWNLKILKICFCLYIKQNSTRLAGLALYEYAESLARGYFLL